MTNLFRALTSPAEERTDFSGLNLNEWVSFFNYNNINYPLGNMRQTLLGAKQELGSDYNGLASGAYAGNAIVFACMLVRALHFSEARFQWRQMRGGRPGNLFGTQELFLLETPWPNGTTGDLLARMLQDVDLAGNSYTVRENDRLARLRPDWVAIMLGSRTNRSNWVAGDADTEVQGYLYWPGGRNSGHDPIPYSPADVAHFTESPDPTAIYRGSSWLTGLSREIMADSAMTAHKLAFFENGATTNMVVSVQAKNQDEFNTWVAAFRESHVGQANAFAPVFLSGADITPVGSDLQQIDFKSVQGAGELRIASAARVPPVLLGLSEGLQGSSLNSGNFNSSRRMFADGWVRPTWRKACAALQTIMNVPGSADLWYDDRDVGFLKEDIIDSATVQDLYAKSIRQLIDAGFKPDTVVDAVMSGDLMRLEHSGMFSVQLQEPTGPQLTPGLKGQLVANTATGGTAIAPTNGNATPPQVPAK